MNNAPNYVMLENDGLRLYQVNQMGGKTPIGYTSDSYEQLLNVAEQYKKKLEDAGLIEKKLTQEEILTKQTELLEKLLSKVDTQESRLSKLEESLGGTDD